MIIGSKAAIAPYVQRAITLFDKNDNSACVGYLQSSILKKKVRFPVLEYAAKELYISIPKASQLALLDSIIALNEIGGNVLAGMVLQLRLEQYFKQSLNKAVEYIIAGNEWYVCDIIGERVVGHALLTMPEQTIPELNKFAKHDDKWIVRSIGVAAHYAVKKGLKKQYADEVFRLLLSLAGTTDFHTKKGIGWAAKTTAKFHPEIIERYRGVIDSDDVKQWFRTKVTIGLGRTWKYAHRYTG
ncbi:MAG: DNA alkylation repair protein [Bacteroidetes bacterium]|nr:DNA alkylation repair protein [Bacteroidota bacterium]